MSEKETVVHGRVSGVLPLYPGMHQSATCTCGWHSHTRTLEEHLAEVEADG